MFYLHYSLGTSRFCSRESFEGDMALEVKSALESFGAKHVLITDTRELNLTHNKLLISKYKPGEPS